MSSFESWYTVDISFPDVFLYLQPERQALCTVSHLKHILYLLPPTTASQFGDSPHGMCMLHRLGVLPGFWERQCNKPACHVLIWRSCRAWKHKAKVLEWAEKTPNGAQGLSFIIYMIQHTTSSQSIILYHCFPNRLRSCSSHMFGKPLPIYKSMQH